MKGRCAAGLRERAQPLGLAVLRPLLGDTPVIASVAPERLDAQAGQTFTITGENFIGTPTVMLDGKTLSNINRIDAQTIVAKLPAGIAPGRFDLVVTNPGGQQAAVRQAVQIGYSVSLPLIAR